MNPTSHRWQRPVWLPLDRYLTHHDQHIKQREGYLVLHDGLSFTFENADVLTIMGRIECVHGMFVTVRKHLEINSRNEVCGFSYRYQACIQTDADVRHIFRYDNADVKQREHHPDAYHKHVNDPLASEEHDLRIEWVGLQNWPTLGDVLDELYSWWQETGQHQFSG